MIFILWWRPQWATENLENFYVHFRTFNRSVTNFFLSIVYIYIYIWWLHNAILQCVTVHRVPKFTSCHNAIMVVTGRAHCSILLYITLQIHSVEHSYGLGGECLRETFTICIMHRSLLAVWALWWLHNAILQCVTAHRVPKFTSCHNAIMVVTGRAHCSILLCIYISGWIFEKVIDSFKPSVPSTPLPSQTFQSEALIKTATVWISQLVWTI